MNVIIIPVIPVIRTNGAVLKKKYNGVVLSEDITVNNSDVYCPPPYTEEGEYRYQYHYLYIDE